MNRHPVSTTLATLVTALLLMPRAVAGVIVVDPPSGPAAQAAIDAAASGDILLVKPSASQPLGDLVINGKGLTLVADGAGITFRKVSVLNLPAGQHVTVRGFTIGGFDDETFAPATAAVTIGSCAGSVWFDSCGISSPAQEKGSFAFGTYPGAPGTAITNSASVLFTGCQIEGGLGAPPYADCFMSGGPPSDGGPGLSVSGSKVTLHGTSCTGGGGMPGGDCTEATDGGAGLSVTGLSSVHIAASTVTGGTAGPSGAGEPPGLAGSGLVVSTTQPAVTLRDSVVVHGASPSFNPDVVAPPGTVSSYPAPARTLALTSPLREGQAGSITIDGQAGDLVALFMAFTGGTLPLSGKQGVFSLGSPFFGPFVLGSNPTGTWTIPFNAPPLMPASLLGQSYLLQLVVHDGTQVLFEGTSTLTVVDDTLP